MKKKIFALVLCVAMLAIAIVGGTMAYFTDTDAQTNTFTAGKVDISLDEAIVAKDAAGNLVATGSRTDETQTLQSYHLFPAMTVTKDPTITVAADSEDAYIAAIVTVTGDIYDLIGVPGYDNIDITKLASGGLMAKASTQVQGWNGLSMVYETEDCVIYQDADKANNTWTLYIFMKAAQAANAKVVLFDTLTIPAAWDNAEMAKINGMNITVTAYATQTNGFADCYSAITAAFDSAFAAVK
ncbi:MAG: hypothetical protein J6A88_05995 [Oscillospiraceae bacterium]|nr:hypothetical protein [Oscillospiraceae bacterium]